MTEDQIRKFLALGEGHNIEFKTSAKNKEALGRVVCGFLNTSGGYLICGVDERGSIPGVDLSNEAISKLEAYLHAKISPKALVEVQTLGLETRPILVLEVPKGHDVPYAFDGAIYIRESDRTHRADAETIRDIVMRCEIEPERWERRFSMADLEEDPDLKEVRAAVQEAEKVGRAFFRNSEDPLAVLEDFAAAKYGRLTNGGDVLFSQNPAQRLPQTRVRAMTYDSDKAGDRYLDMKSFEGPLHAVFQDAYAFILRNTPSVSRFIQGQPKRQDSPLYPGEAVREALINALAHRDYSASSGGVAVHIYPKRLEIWNTGALPEGMTVEQLAKGELSVLRNPDIAHVLYLRGLMEKAGRGSVLMVRQCREHGLPDPRWTSDETRGVTVTFSAESAKTLDLNERQKHLLTHLAPGDAISRQDYAQQFASDVSERTARRDLSELEEHGLLNRKGSGPTTTYIRTGVKP